MKISRNVIQIGGTALVTSLVFFTCNLLRGGPGFTIKSGPIDWPEAERRKTEYEGSNQAMKVRYTDSRTRGEKTEVLKGLVFEAKHLDALINKNSQGIKPDTVILYFGRQNSFFDWPTLKWYANLNIIAVGVKNGQILTKDVYNKADPCPPYCP